MFHRFSHSARSVVFRAHEIAQSHEGRFIEPDHILLALIVLHPQLFSKLTGATIDIQEIKQEISKPPSSSHGSRKSRGLKLSEESKCVLLAAVREADSCRSWLEVSKTSELPKWLMRWRLWRDWRVDERHILLGFLVNPEIPCSVFLLRRGVTLETARQRLLPG